MSEPLEPMSLEQAQAVIEQIVIRPQHTFDGEEVEALEAAIGVLRWAQRRPDGVRLYRPFGEGLSPETANEGPIR